MVFFNSSAACWDRIFKQSYDTEILLFVWIYGLIRLEKTIHLNRVGYMKREHFNNSNALAISIETTTIHTMSIGR